MANVLMVMAMHNKFGSDPRYRKFKAVVAAPGVTGGTDLFKGHSCPLVENHLMGPPDGACSFITAMFAPSVKSGDLYEPHRLIRGPPTKVIDQGTPLSPVFP